MRLLVGRTRGRAARGELHLEHDVPGALHALEVVVPKPPDALGKALGLLWFHVIRYRMSILSVEYRTICYT